MLFGPAYKGIPLVTAVAIAYSNERDRSLPYSFNRKEEKDHGEGGVVAGAPLNGAVLVIDDVITAGTSVHFSMELIRRHGARDAAAVIALDRQERGRDGADASAIEEIRTALRHSGCPHHYPGQPGRIPPERSGVFSATQGYTCNYREGIRNPDNTDGE